MLAAADPMGCQHLVAYGEHFSRACLDYVRLLPALCTLELQIETAYADSVAVGRCISSLTALTCLDLSWMKIVDPWAPTDVGGFPDDIFACTALEVLRLMPYRDAWGAVPQQLSQLQRLSHLQLEGCGVTALPTSLNTLTRLKIVAVSELLYAMPRIRLSELPDQLAALRSLKVLMATMAQCPAVASRLAGLTQVRVNGVTGESDAEAWHAALGSGSKNPGLHLAVWHSDGNGGHVYNNWGKR